MPLVTPGNNPKIVIDSYLDNSEFDSRVASIRAKLDDMTVKLKQQGDISAAAAKKSTMSWTDFRSMYSTVLDVVRVGQQVWDATVDKAQEYDQKIKGVMDSTKGTAEETSRLVQTLDDAGIGFDTVKLALKEMSKDGTAPTIKELAALSDEFLKLETGAERGQFLLDKFGKSGDEMARAMALGGDEILRLSAAQNNNLILTQKEIDASEKYRQNVDELTDSWDSYVVSIGNDVIPLVNQWVENQKNYNEALDETIRLYGNHGDRANNFRVALMLEAKYAMEARDATNAHADALDGILSPALEGANEAIINYNSSFDDLLSTSMKITDMNKDYVKSQEDIKEQISDLEEEKAGMYSWETDAIQGVQDKIDDLNGKYQENAEEHKQRTDKIILDMALEKIAMSDGEKGFSEAEYNKAIAVASTIGAVEEATVRETMMMDQITTAIANGTLAADNLGLAIEQIPSGKSIDVILNVVASLASNAAVYQQTQGEKNYVPARNQHAMGGMFQIPSSYGNEGFMLGGGDTASGGEKLKIIPEGGSSGGVIVNILLDSATPDPERVAYNLGPAVKRVLRAEGII